MIIKCWYNIITQNGKYHKHLTKFCNYCILLKKKTKMDKIIILSTHFTPNLYYYFPPPPSLLPFTVTVLSIYPFNRSQTRKAILALKALFPLYLIILHNNIYITAFLSLKSVFSLFTFRLESHSQSIVIYLFIAFNS